MMYIVNGKERNTKEITKRAPRQIQVEAINKIEETINDNSKILVNMPCRTGKTYTTLYAAYNCNVEFVIALCGKASAKSGYANDSVWKNASGKVEGFDLVATDNTEIKKLLKDVKAIKAKKMLVEVTPQLLNVNEDVLNKLAEIAKTRKTVIVFDEAHFAEQTEKTQAILDVLNKFKSCPHIYLTASPDTESLQKQFNIDANNYYEVTKEMEWELYTADLKKDAKDREFSYVPVRNCLCVMDKILDSVFDATKQKKQDYSTLFTAKTCEKSAQEFVIKTLRTVLKTVNAGPEKTFMDEDETTPYSVRGNNINVMIKVPVNKNLTDGQKTVAERIMDMIVTNKEIILDGYGLQDINVIDVTLTNSVGQDQANFFFDSHPNCLNIILTQQRLIEGTTLHTLDAFVYYTNCGSLCKYKQESGRTLTPADNKRFGFVFFFDEANYSLVKGMLMRKISQIKGTTKGSKKLTSAQASSLTRVNPTFILSSEGDMKIVDYSKSLWTLTQLVRSTNARFVFDEDRLFKIEGLKDALISNKLLGVFNNNKKSTPATPTTTPATPATTTSASGTKSAPVVASGVELDKLVNKIICVFQNCIQDDINCDELTEEVKLQCEADDIPAKVMELLYNDSYAYDVLMEMYEVVEEAQNEVNPEEE